MKIATCCHCGTRSVLKPDAARHALACDSCGAPLRDLKALPVAKAEAPAVSHRPSPRQFGAAPRPVVAKTAGKKRKGWFGRRFKDIAEDVFDAVEDIFD